jgi:hypothetical protein
MVVAVVPAGTATPHRGKFLPWRNSLRRFLGVSVIKVFAIPLPHTASVDILVLLQLNLHSIEANKVYVKKNVKRG